MRRGPSLDRKDSVSHPETGSSEYASLADPSPIISRSKPHIYLDISRSIRRSMRFVIEVSTIDGGLEWIGSLFGNFSNNFAGEMNELELRI